MRPPPPLPTPDRPPGRPPARAQTATNDMVMGYQEHTARLERRKADAALERSVLKLFHLDPEKLQVRVRADVRAADGGLGVAGWLGGWVGV